MKRSLLALGIMALTCLPALAGKNQGGALVVHSRDEAWFSNACDWFDYLYPDITCPELDTRSDKPDYDTALIWFIAAFPPYANPGVKVIYFGLDHNLPPDLGYIEGRMFCGPDGSFEYPDAGWPEYPATAGNSLTFGTAVVDDLLFPFYVFRVYGFAGAYFCTHINPVAGYASFVDNSDPPVQDVITKFGCVRWYQEGYNGCPAEGPLGACCYGSLECAVLTEEECGDLPDDYLWIEGEVCDPNPCPTSDVPEPTIRETTWGSIKAVYK